MEELWEQNPYSMNHQKKTKYYQKRMRELTKKHQRDCKAYANLLKQFDFSLEEEHKIEEYPFLPVRLFKESELKSVRDEDVVKTMTSSGTSGQQVSKIYLDKVTSTNQTKTLVKITSEFLERKDCQC